VEEIINNQQQNKKGFLRKATATGVMLVALAGCGEQSIKEGTVVKKERVEAHTKKNPVWMRVGNQLTYGLFKVTENVPEKWTVQIAQCPQEELPPPDKIEKECKTNSFAVPQEVFNSLQIGQRADFKQTK
jgi:hypothetical protein